MMKVYSATLALATIGPLAQGFLPGLPAGRGAQSQWSLTATVRGGKGSTPSPPMGNADALSMVSAASLGSLKASGGAADDEQAALVKEIKMAGSKKMHHKCLRKYKALRKLGGNPDEEGYTQVLAMCVKGKVGAVTDKIIADMAADPALEASSGGGVQLKHVLLGLEACALSSRPVEAVKILDKADELGITVNLAAYTHAMAACVSAPNALPIEDLARKVMRKVRAAGSAVSLGGEYYGLLLQVLVRVKRHKEAIACFDLMCLDSAFTPRSEHYLAVMKAATAIKDQELVKSLLGEILMDEMRFESHYGAIMQMASKAMANADNYRLAVKLFEKVPEAERSYDLYHSIVASCGRNKNTVLATEVFDLMKAKGMAPKRATYNAVLHACSAQGEVSKARQILEEMTREGIRLNVVTYNIALNSRAKAGDARGAVNLLSEMDNAGITPSVVSFATAINAAAAFNSSSLATTLMEAMKPAGLVPNAYVFTAALAACENDPDDTAAASATQLIVDTMAETEAQKGMDKEMVQRIGKQALRLLKRDLGVRDLENLATDEAVLGVSLKGRQSAI
mmetsp:Transcript_36962/g.82804  ORF Transcript_36962/g.82804 Transcript_36962/m.82804 type:complete len:567 (+) Transcript_36962:88-1788(+)